MARPRRIAWDSSCFIAWLERKQTEDPAVLSALAETMRGMVRGQVRIVASNLILLEVRAGSVEETRAFHRQLRACPYFEAFTDSVAVHTVASDLADRVQESGRKAKSLDLLHVATAIAARAEEFWTTDAKMIRWYTQGVITEVVICRPYLEQGVLDFPE